MKLILLLLLIFTTYATSAQPLLYGERAEVQILENYIWTYVQNHNGSTPASWQDLQASGFDIESLSKEYAHSRGVPIEAKWMFINQVFDVPSRGERKVVMLRTSPIDMDGAGPARLLIYQNEKNGGKLGSAFVYESEANKLFVDAGMTFPGKGNKVDRESMVDGKGKYLAGDPTPRPATQTTAVPIGQSTVTRASQAPKVSPTSPPVASSSSDFMIIVSIIAAGLLAGTGLFFLMRKK
jgi:hypothetical protein